MIDDLLDFLDELAGLCKEVADSFISWFVEEDDSEDFTSSGPDYVKRVIRDVVAPSLIIGFFKVFVSRTGLGHTFPQVYRGFA